MSEIIEKSERDRISIWPHIDEETQVAYSGRAFMTRDEDVAPEVANRLQLQIQYLKGLDRTTWGELKAAGDRVFAWAEGE